MKIHNPNNLDVDVDLSALRAMVRGDLDPVRQAIDERREAKLPAPPLAKKAAEKPEKSKTKASAGSGSANFPAPKAGGAPPQPVATAVAVKARKPADSAVRDPEALEREKTRLVNRRRMLAQVIQACEALEVVNPEVLAMSDYPTPERLLLARRWRDLWVVLALLSSGLALMGWLGMINAVTAGIAAGVLVFLLALLWRPVRGFLFRAEHSYPALISSRKSLEFKAMSHIKMLEGTTGLAWQCQAMRERHPVLGEKRFERMVLLSRQGQLLKAMRNVAAFRFYLQYLLEARKSFAEVKKEYLEVVSRLAKEFSVF